MKHVTKFIRKPRWLEHTYDRFHISTKKKCSSKIYFPSLERSHRTRNFHLKSPSRLPILSPNSLNHPVNFNLFKFPDASTYQKLLFVDLPIFVRWYSNVPFVTYPSYITSYSVVTSLNKRKAGKWWVH